MKAAANVPPVVLKPEVVGAQLDIPAKRVRALVHLGELEGVRVGGPRSLRILASSVAAFLERNRIGKASA